MLGNFIWMVILTNFLDRGFKLYSTEHSPHPISLCKIVSCVRLRMQFNGLIRTWKRCGLVKITKLSLKFVKHPYLSCTKQQGSFGILNYALGMGLRYSLTFKLPHLHYTIIPLPFMAHLLTNLLHKRSQQRLHPPWLLFFYTMALFFQINFLLVCIKSLWFSFICQSIFNRLVPSHLSLKFKALFPQFQAPRFRFPLNFHMVFKNCAVFIIWDVHRVSLLFRWQLFLSCHFRRIDFTDDCRIYFTADLKVLNLLSSDHNPPIQLCNLIPLYPTSLVKFLHRLHYFI